jgi:hypothetical protein
MKAKFGQMAVLIMVPLFLAQQKGLAAEGIPLPTGTFAMRGTGSIAICLDPATFKEQACTTKGVVDVFTVLQVGTLTADQEGNICQTIVETDSSLPLDTTPPLVTRNNNFVGTVTKYEPKTGTGDASFTGYSGGTCRGAIFDATGATQTGTGTTHFVASENGKRIDTLITSLANSTDSVGDFSLSTVDRKLNP